MFILIDSNHELRLSVMELHLTVSSLLFVVYTDKSAGSQSIESYHDVQMFNMLCLPW